MEIQSVNIDELDVTQEEQFDGVAIKHYTLPKAEGGAYRVFFANDAYEDVVADNASHAFQQIGRSDIVRIVQVSRAYDDMLDKDILQPSGEKVQPSIATDVNDTVIIADIEATQHEAFQTMDMHEIAHAYRQEDE